MKKVLSACLCLAFLCAMSTDVDAKVSQKNSQAKWALHYAGVHNSRIHTCAMVFTDCVAEVDVNGSAGPGRFDIYMLAIEHDGIAGTRYGICCPEGWFFFYGWTKCSDSDIPTPGWPGCGEGIVQSWSSEQPAWNTTMGILDVYVYAGSAQLCVCDDPRVGFAEWCDGTSPEPICKRRYKAISPEAFGCVGFGVSGYNPCYTLVGTENPSWGAVKSLYR